MSKLISINPGNDYGGYKASVANYNYVIGNVINGINLRCSIAIKTLKGSKAVDIIESTYN